ACESRTAWLSQGRDIIWRQGGKDSHWGADNGLKALLRLAMNLSLLGYDLLMPDMVPGRVQTLRSDAPLPSDELMVRWTEVSAFMPFLQFSYFPWNYAEGTDKVVRRFARLHKQLEDYLAQESKDRVAPLIRPVWYDDPESVDAYSIDDEFQLGGDILLAPVLDRACTVRDVYLPQGEWVDAWTGTVVTSGWLRDCPAPCPGMPIFVRRDRQDLLAIIQAELAELARGCIDPAQCTASYMAGLDRDLSVTG
ncbi:MAG: TIM-barrel domain-containing protein, partial [Puniceicoccales bacterium]